MLSDFALSMLDLGSLILLHHWLPMLEAAHPGMNTHEDVRVGGHMAGGLSKLGKFSKLAQKSGRFGKALLRAMRLIRIWRVLRAARPLVQLIQQCTERTQRQRGEQQQQDFIQRNSNNSSDSRWTCFRSIFNWCDLFDMGFDSNIAVPASASSRKDQITAMPSFFGDGLSKSFFSRPKTEDVRVRDV